MHNKIIGIIGGFGPETSAAFQLEIVDLCAANKLCTRPAILMWNAPIPVQIEDDLILKGKSIDKFLPFLITSAKILEKAGADLIVFPCNTLHVFINEIRNAVSIPVLSIIEELAIFLKQNSITAVGLMGTKITVTSKMHSNKLHSLGIHTVIPSKDDQNRIDKIIHNILNKKDSAHIKQKLELIIKPFRTRGIHHIVLACTDLQLFFPHIQGIIIHDTMDILARATVREIMKNKQ